MKVNDKLAKQYGDINCAMKKKLGWWSIKIKMIFMHTNIERIFGTHTKILCY